MRKKIYCMVVLSVICVLLDVVISAMSIRNYKEITITHEQILENLKDFKLCSDGSIVSESDDPWVWCELPESINVKSVQINVDAVNTKNTWAEIHYILENGNWVGQSFDIEDGINTIRINKNQGLNKIYIMRFDLLNVKGASLKVSDIIINNKYLVTLPCHIVCLITLFILLLLSLVPQSVVRYIHNYYKIVGDQIRKIKDNINEKTKVLWRLFLTILIIYLVGVSAILRANFNYIDDMGRAACGYTGWGRDFSRYISDFLSVFIHADNYLTDVSPLPQIVAIVFLAFAATIVFYILTEKKTHVCLERLPFCHWDYHHTFWNVFHINMTRHIWHYQFWYR